ncbi:MAG: hypothetical protein QY321_01470 [Patescibacteria group bacterium]|nr:MAG: hypothetical protein QY321_01470 [Patescibacteria group bacterium]
MNVNKKALAILVAGLLVIFLIIYFIFIHDFDRDEEFPDAEFPTDQPTQVEPVVEVVGEAPSVAVPPRTSSEINRDQVQQVSSYFATRYGSASSQADFGNLEDLEVFVTDEMWISLSEEIRQRRAALTQAPEYESIVTQVVVAQIDTISDIIGTAQVTVKTKRQSINTNGETSEFGQDLKLSLRLIGEEWKVESAQWVE